MSDTEAAVAIEELNAAPSNVEEENEQVEIKVKAKKKGKVSKKHEDAFDEEEDVKGGISVRGKKKKGKKKVRKGSDALEIQPVAPEVGENKQLERESAVGEALLLDETPKETIVEIKDEKQADDLEEIVVKKEEASIEGGNLVQDDGKASIEGTIVEGKENEAEESRGGVRRRATLTDLKADSIDKGDGERADSIEAVSEEQEAVKEESNNETKIDVVTLEEDNDSKETTSTEAREITASLQIQGEPEQENSAEMGDRNIDNADRVALEVSEKVDEVAIPVEDEIKTEKEGEEEGEDNPESTKGMNGKPVAVETTVTNETETGKDYLKYEELDDELPWAMYRSLDTPPQRPPIEEDEDWPASDNDEDYGNVLCKFQ
ncbi:PREDICTED: high mobility group nucleosome-binding domain-containing protein 5-like [Acropora digitifera]|uniref:high mobility group nucleosome-binding domain-containing protein 5-like n=1 Tax=Acropora digitifera TaxID=70779 RepID=UPI00077AD594|nr:PREDICTED: high mobility group nucleosome-binding domain-containing protein 5-like [Acropora digitifera]